MTRVKPAEVQFYIDADVLGLAHVLAAMRVDTTFPGDPGARIRRRVRAPCPITTPSEQDEDWIPVVAQRGWLIISRDRHIRDQTRQIQLIKDYSARMVVLSGQEAKSTFEQLEIVMCQWRRIEQLLTRPAPLLYTATRTSLLEFNLG